MSFNESLNKIVESKQFATTSTIMVASIWLITGLGAVFPMPNATLRSQWAYGYLFGLLFMSMSTWILAGIIKFLCVKSPIFEAFVDKHFSNTEEHAEHDKEITK